MDDEDALLAIGLLLMLTMNNSDVTWGDGWVWPVPTLMDPDGRVLPAAISQEFRPPSHKGVDIMYRDDGKWTAPEGTPIIAAHDATVWSTGETARGHNVVLDHGPPWATFYQHLVSLAPGIVKGARVRAGDHLGFMGADPTDPQGLRHLHFETWYKGNGDAAVDPAKAMAAWGRIQWQAA